MKRTWRILLVILIPIFLMTACSGKVNEVPVTQEEAHEVQIQNQEKKNDVEQEAYEIISVQVENHPDTNVNGGIRYEYFIQYINFCYLKENEVVFTTLALNEDNNYEVHCSMGEKNMVEIITQDKQFYRYTIYNIFLKPETYQSIYN